MALMNTAQVCAGIGAWRGSTWRYLQDESANIVGLDTVGANRWRETCVNLPQGATSLPWVCASALTYGGFTVLGLRDHGPLRTTENQFHLRSLMSLHRTTLLALFVVVAACDDASDAKPSENGKARPTAAAQAPENRVNLNTAHEEDFKKIPGVGEKMAHEFDEYRPYASITQFRKEMGKYVDEATVAGYEAHVFVPVAFNDCDAATLQQIPGVDAAAAQTLIAGRPYDGDVAFLTKVGEVGGEAAETAAMDLIVKEGE